MELIVNFSSGDKTFSSIEELKDYCCAMWQVQRFQVKVDKDGGVCLYDKLGVLFAVVGTITQYRQ